MTKGQMPLAPLMCHTPDNALLDRSITVFRPLKKISCYNDTENKRHSSTYFEHKSRNQHLRWMKVMDLAIRDICPA